ncbi:hypothetical protein JOF35_005343 [Streptomyces demainii]|uniref:Uncharacterized protein n=1 Tax=Streptomyces demainii TaxID=588122 RepID=A0ABT9KX46_9ACTN|nr:hypothetical protein [Streptomyces demainii]
MPEHTIGPSGLSKNTFPTGAMFWWYGRETSWAGTAGGSGSVAAWSCPALCAETVFGESSASAILEGRQKFLMIGLANSDALRAHVSQSFQPPSFHFFRSSRLVGTPSGNWIPSLACCPVEAAEDSDAEAALSSPEPQPEAETTSSAVMAAAATVDRRMSGMEPYPPVVVQWLCCDAQWCAVPYGCFHAMEPLDSHLLCPRPRPTPSPVSGPAPNTNALSTIP